MMGFMLMVYLLVTIRTAGAEHRYYTGVVTEVSYTSITVNSETYPIGSKAKILERRNDGGVLIEKKASRSELIPGKKVSLRLDDDVATEIVIISSGY